jgi:hypothetical protein
MTIQDADGPRFLGRGGSLGNAKANQIQAKTNILKSTALEGM